jgi:hypothetical protein
MSDIVRLLTGRRKFRHGNDSEKYCLVPHEMLCSAIDEIERLREALREAAMIAENGCLVPPDGGSPTEDERLMCRAIAVRILALSGAKDE